MQFIEMSGKKLLSIATEGGPNADDLVKMGVTKDSMIRINRQGDIELRRKDCWDVIGGLLGDFEDRLRKSTGLDWA